MPSFGVSAISAKNPSLFNIFSTSDIQLMKSPQYDKQYFNMHYGFERPFLPAGVFYLAILQVLIHLSLR